MDSLTLKIYQMECLAEMHHTHHENALMGDWYSGIIHFIEAIKTDMSLQSLMGNVAATLANSTRQRTV